MKSSHKLIAYLKLLLFAVLLTGMVIPVAITIHESVHVITYTLEGLQILSFHVLDQAAFSHGALGHVDVRGKTAIGHGIHEFIAYTIEILSGGALLLFFLFFAFKKFTRTQLISMGFFDIAGGEEKKEKEQKKYGDCLQLLRKKDEEKAK